MNSIIDYMEHWAAIQPDKCFSSFLDVHGNATENYTYSEFNERSRHLAEHLAEQVGLKRGDRALLVYPPGLEVIVAFVACARIGAIPVPVSPPTSVNVEGSLAKLAFVATDCDANVALTTTALYRSYRKFAERPINSLHLHSAPALPNVDWFTTDDIRGRASERFYNEPSPILFLQYTSGSTSEPKGVIVSHENVIHNCLATTDHTPTAVCWLPQYHDMGLIGYYIFLVITGGTTYGFSPTDFLKRPILWLQTLSRVRATYTSSPNFGFEYCLREDRIPTHELCDLDLSSVRILMNASEPVRAETYRRFIERFTPYGLQPQAPVVAYGLAENTLAVSHYGRQKVTVNKQLLQEGKLHIEAATKPNENQLSLVSCGKPLDGMQVRIVDPKSCSELESGQIGEIWVAGPSKCQGYWNRPELSREVFENRVANNPDDHNLYLRTGDLGFMQDSELFVCGREKDLIIIRGINYYPQDIEAIVEAVLHTRRGGGVAAFAGGDEAEMLVVLIEARDLARVPNAAEISRALRSQYYNGPHTIAFVPPRSIVRTTSGKVARSLTRMRWLNSEIPPMASHLYGVERPHTDTLPTDMSDRFGYLLEQYNLTGEEEYTLAEIGADSLTLVMLVLDIEQLLKENRADDLVSEIDGRVLQRLTVAKFFSIINQLQNGSDEPIEELRVAVALLRKENDSYERHCMRLDAQLGISSDLRLPAQEPMRNVLLTGPTGFFGPFLLSSLLQLTPYTYYLLTRASDQIDGMDRVRGALRNACLWTPTLESQLQARVHIVCGDISRKQLGLGSEEWERLATDVQAVFHNAALVNYVLNYDALRPPNIEGTREILHFCFTGRRKELHVISSTVIFGWTPMPEVLETDNNAEMANLDFGYAQTKWVAEQLVYSAEKQGLKVRVYRPSFISASGAGIASKDDIVIRLLTFMIKHGIAVEAGNQVSFLPADVAAHNIAAIFASGSVPHRTLHVTVDHFYTLPDITRLITQEYGVPFVYYDVPRFVAELTRRCPVDDPLYPLLDFFNRSHPKISKMEHKRYNNQRYLEARRMAGVTRQDPTLEEIVSNLMAYMLREGAIRLG